MLLSNFSTMSTKHRVFFEITILSLNNIYSLSCIIMWNNILQYNIDWETSQKAYINYYPWYEYKLIKDIVLGEGEKQTYTHELNWTYFIVYTNTIGLDTSSNNLTILYTPLILLTIPVHSIVMYTVVSINFKHRTHKLCVFWIACLNMWCLLCLSCSKVLIFKHCNNITRVFRQCW